MDKQASTEMIQKSEDLPERILVVDDEEVMQNFLKDALSSKHYVVDTSSTCKEAFEKMENNNYNLVLLDINMPEMSGAEFLKYSKRYFPKVEFIMITGMPDINQAVKIIKDGAYDYLIKPLSMEKLLNKIKEAMLYQRINREYVEDSESTRNHILCKGYRLINTLATGSMGNVHLVKKAGKYYAMKILRKELDEDVDGITFKEERFLREAQILKEIDHPNIVKIYEYGLLEDDNAPFMVMEFISGKSLTHYLATREFDFNQKITVMTQIASALDVVHSKGVFHRDIKPSNIMITDDDFCVKIADFGIARVMDSSLTMSDDIFGSPAYMSPESFESVKHIDHKSDIFSFGVLSYEMITGKKPFDSNDLTEIIDLIRNSRPLAPTKVVPDLSSFIEDILAKMLCKNPDDRFQSAGEIVKAINKFKAGEFEEKPPGKKGFSRKILQGFRSKNRVWR